MMNDDKWFDNIFMDNARCIHSCHMSYVYNKASVETNADLITINQLQLQLNNNEDAIDLAWHDAWHDRWRRASKIHIGLKVSMNLYDYLTLFWT